MPTRHRVLVTGAASGIGRATVRHLLAHGHQVVALDIDAEGLDALPAEVTTHVADVTDEQRVRDVVADSSFDTLVNCAATYELGAVEDVSGETVERQFRTNVFGTLTVTRAALPTLRRNRGRVITLSSVLGRVSLPFHGVYAGTKHAVEALFDALRMEVEPLGVDVVLVEPGAIRSGFNERAIAALRRYVEGPSAGTSATDTPSADTPATDTSSADTPATDTSSADTPATDTSSVDTPYTDRYQRVLSGYDPGGESVDSVARVVVRAIEADQPKPRYEATRQATIVPLLNTLLPTRTFDRLANARVENKSALAGLRDLLR
ncbi:MAG: SDR family NAD(P)-dependent oxidoreductase [Halobacteriota archaeon]